MNRIKEALIEAGTDSYVNLRKTQKQNCLARNLYPLRE